MLPVNGYTALVNRMLAHSNIDVRLNTIYSRTMDNVYEHVFNSMSIDEFFNFDAGVLPYRSIKFHSYSVPIPHIFSVATVNFTHDEKFTRVTEWKNFPHHGQCSAYTSLTIEEPCDFEENGFERYYPVKDLAGLNRDLYKRYRSRIPNNQTFIGRCGLYAYLNMDQAISMALSIAHNFLAERD
jgi:UDP-galactopyranose mutase